jgi:hypothetical protein
MTSRFDEKIFQGILRIPIISASLPYISEIGRGRARIHAEKPIKNPRFQRSSTSWFQTTIIVSRDDVLDHDLIFSDNHVVN